jgi:ABC-type transporter Mla subunit MlaD
MKQQLNGSRRARRRRESARPTHVLLAGLVTAAAVLIFTVIGLRAPGGLPLTNYRTLYVSFYDSGNLQPRNEVRIHGVQVGQVLAVRPQEGRAVAELQLRPGTPALAKDTVALLRARGLLGARYVELIPGHAPAKLGVGATLQARPDALKFGVPETLETFNAATRGGLGTTLRALGTGLLGRGQQLSDTLRLGARPATQFPGVVDAILARPGAAQRLAPSLDAGSSALDAARHAITRDVPSAAAAFEPFARSRSDLGSAIDQAPATLSALNTGLDHGASLVAAAGVLARSASAVLPSAPGGLRAATALLRESPVPLARTDRLVRAAGPAVAPTIKLLHRVDPLLPRARVALGDLTPLVGTLGRFGCDIDNFAENWRSALGYGINTPGDGPELPSGHIGPNQAFRITVDVGVQSTQDVGGTAKPLATRVPYPRPCAYSPGATYPVVNLQTSSRKASR